MLNNLRYKLANAISPKHRKQQRSINAADSQYNPDWQPVSLSADLELKNSLKIVRAKARDLENNDSYVAKFIHMSINNIVGPNGFSYQAYVRKPNGELDYNANKFLENLWYKFCENPTVDGRLSFLGLLELVIRYYVRDGEAIIRTINNFPNSHGFALQLIEPDLLDERFVDVLPNKNIVRLGVETDDWLRPVNYHFKKIAPGADMYMYDSYSTERISIPAGEIVHLYKLKRSTQTRGISHLVQSIIDLRMLNAYQYAALVNARIGASKMGFFTRDASSNGYQGEEDEYGRRTMNVTPGTFEELEPGVKISTWDPKFPEEQHESFIRSVLRKIASGLGISYNNLANDLVGVNYSSIRAGLLDERIEWMKEQNYIRDMVILPIYNRWVKWNYINGNLDKLRGYKIEQLLNSVWTGKRWPWVDPLKDITANIKAIEAGLKSRAKVIEESDQDSDVYDILEQLKIEKDLIEKYGLGFMINNGKDNNEVIDADKE